MNVKANPCLDIWMHRESEHFVITNHAIDPDLGLPASWGDLIPTSADVMKSRGLGIVLDNLAGFQQRRRENPSAFEKMPKSRHQRFRREHGLVIVEMLDEEHLRISPMHKHRGGGYMSNPDEVVVFEISRDDEEFYRVILAAFEGASSRIAGA